MPRAGARSLPVLLALLILSPLLAGKAFGVTVPGPVEVLCDGDCAGLAVTDIVPSVAPLDFELGLRITGSGLDLSVRSEGSVFLRSPIRATDSIRLVGGRDIRIGPGALVSSGSLSVLSGSLVPLAADGVTTGSGIQLAGGTTTAGSTRSTAPSVAALGGTAPSDPRVLGYAVARAGDLYLDLSGVVLANLDVDAKLDLYLDGAGAIPTPEPGGTMLIGLGLALLALRRSAR